MNSGLQCLSNTIELTKYFCFNLYKQDINKDNPLGMGGKLANTYAELVKEMWLGNSGRV
jgi:ubiquitin carboxyl-terminal hydrolase 4/11/15